MAKPQFWVPRRAISLGDRHANVALSPRSTRQGPLREKEKTRVNAGRADRGSYRTRTGSRSKKNYFHYLMDHRIFRSDLACGIFLRGAVDHPVVFDIRRRELAHYRCRDIFFLAILLEPV